MLVILSVQNIDPTSGFLFCYSQLAIIANRKNVDQHIVLFDWSRDDKKEAAMVEILNDAWIPRIDCRGDQNL